MSDNHLGEQPELDGVQRESNVKLRKQSVPLWAVLA